MNLKEQLKKLVPYLVAIVLFVVISFAYFSPILDGKDLPQMDNVHAKGMSQEILSYEAQYPGENFLWTNSMFGGMPAYQIKGAPTHNVYHQLVPWLRLWLPYTTVSILFLYLLGFYVLLLTLKFDKWLAFLGAVAFALGSYNLIIIGAGHITKAYAIAIMAPVLAGFILTYKGKYFSGGILTMLALGVQLAMNHPQITYYTGLMVAVYLAFEVYSAIKEKAIVRFGKASAVVVLAVVLAVLPSMTSLWTTYEYSKETTRGKSELTATATQKADGLERNYAMSWSYGVKETLTFMIPNMVGGANGSIGANENAMKNVDPQFQQSLGGQDQYWGDQPFTSGPVYLGAIICFLFLLGVVYVNGPLKWALLTATLFSIMLSWGHNLGGFNNFMFDYLPMYNKFRTVSMTLVIASVTVPLLGLLGLRELVLNPDRLKKERNKFFIALGATAGVSLVFALIPQMFSFLSGQELRAITQQRATIGPENIAQFNMFVDQLQGARITIFRADALRSLVYILLAAGAVYAFALKKINAQVMTIILIVLVSVDLWSVDKRYLNDENFKESETVATPFVASNADKIIQKDVNDIGFRVVNLGANVFNEVNTSYFHKSIGGYHGAKLRRYQDLIDSYLLPSIDKYRAILSGKDSTESIYSAMAKDNVFNMLNTKYLIVNPNTIPVVNMSSLGSAWFVNDLKVVDNANVELAELGKFNPRTTALVDKRFSDYVSKFVPADPADSTRRMLIKLITYKPNELTYQVFTSNEGLAVFSKIYYKAGWNAYLNNVPTDHIRVNYLLRGMMIPKGRYLLTFKFEPKSYYTGSKIATASSALVLLLILAWIGLNIKGAMAKPKEAEVTKK